jgi:hypothetical protein
LLYWIDLLLNEMTGAKVFRDRKDFSCGRLCNAFALPIVFLDMTGVEASSKFFAGGISAGILLSGFLFEMTGVESASTFAVSSGGGRSSPYSLVGCLNEDILCTSCRSLGAASFAFVSCGGGGGLHSLLGRLTEAILRTTCRLLP